MDLILLLSMTVVICPVFLTALNTTSARVTISNQTVTSAATFGTIGDHLQQIGHELVQGGEIIKDGQQNKTQERIGKSLIQFGLSGWWENRKKEKAKDEARKAAKKKQDEIDQKKRDDDEKERKRILEAEEKAEKAALQAKINKEGIEKVMLEAAGKGIFFLFVCFLLGAIFRHFLNFTRLPIPYTVVMFAIGISIGLGSTKMLAFKDYAKVAKMDSHMLMNIFLPALIFESAFSMDAHMFKKSLYQCLILALFGVVICQGLLTGYALTGLSSLKWSLNLSLLFAVVLTATDPVAVVSLVKESGVPARLTTLIEGESLVNGALTIFIFNILLEVLEEKMDHLTVAQIIIKISLMCLGAPIIGKVVGFITTCWLSTIYRDEILEFTITLCATYLSFLLANLYGVSGVLTVLVLGVEISTQKSCFSPETEQSVRSLWQVLSYYANTFIFIIVGNVTYLLSKDLSTTQIGLSVCTYCFATIFRLLMVGILSPLLARTGYGLTWREAIAVTWGGLRGAVGMALAMTLCEHVEAMILAKTLPDELSEQLLFQICMCILLTSAINGTSMKFIANALGMNEMSQSHKIAMGNAVSNLRETAIKSIKLQKKDKFLSDANWLWVSSHTFIKGPAELSGEFDQSCAYTPYREMRCIMCDAVTSVQPTAAEKVEMEEEGRLRILKSLKSIYANYYEQSFITRGTVQILTTAANDAIDIPGAYISAQVLRERYMTVPRIVEAVLRVLSRWHNKIKVYEISDERKYVTEVFPYATGCRWFCMKAFMKPYFDPIILVTTILNVIPIILMRVAKNTGKNELLYTSFSITLFFFLVYALEFSSKVIALGFSMYIKRLWNKVAFSLIILDVITIVLEFIGHFFGSNFYNLSMSSRLIRLIRIFEMYTLALELMSKFVVRLQNMISGRLYDSYDLGFAFVIAQEEVLEKLDFVQGYQSCGSEPIIVAETNILAMLKAMTDIQLKHPGVTIALKTHKTCLKIFNDVLTTLNELRETGMVDEAEYEQLLEEIDTRKQSILNSAKALPVSEDPAELIRKIDWLNEDNKLIDCVEQNYVIKSFSAHQTIEEIGESAESISVVMSGVVKVSGRSEPKTDQLPNVHSTEYFKSSGRFFDYMSTLRFLGLLGYLVDTNYVSSARCETPVEILQINNSFLRDVEKDIVDQPPLTFLLWRYLAVKIAFPLLKELPRFQSMRSNRLKVELEKCVLPNLARVTRYDVPPRVQTVVLIQGKVKDHYSGTVFIGPQNIPASSSSLILDADVAKRARVVLLLLPEEQFEPSDDLDWSYNVGDEEDDDDDEEEEEDEEISYETDRIISIDRRVSMDRRTSTDRRASMGKRMSRDERTSMGRRASTNRRTSTGTERRTSTGTERRISTGTERRISTDRRISIEPTETERRSSRRRSSQADRRPSKIESRF